MTARLLRARRLPVVALLLAGLFSVMPCAAQYVYNPANADEGPGIRYFGSAKDEKGALLTGVSVLISSGQSSFLMVTDDEGRFRSNLPLEMLPDKVTAKCFKAGYQLAQVDKRPGPVGPKVTVQVDCILRASRAANRAPDPSGELEALRHRGDLRSQRRHAWQVLARVTGLRNGEPAFESWYGEDLVFATETPSAAARGIRGFSHVSPSKSTETPVAADAHAGSVGDSADTPVVTHTLYNESAYQHIRSNHLFSETRLREIRTSALAEPEGPARTVPPFPRQAMILKTAWWPVAGQGVTPLPVWDAEANPTRKGGNDYTSWARLVVVDPSLDGAEGTPLATEFAGTAIAEAPRVGLSAFYHVSVTEDLAARMARDTSASKLALIVLGRPIQKGDTLLLVGANVATKEIDDWVWATMWWHDRGTAGPYAADRPVAGSVWNHYLMQVAFDEVAPTQADGTPHVCFNPWLEGRFPDGGHGSGTVSNCQACHRRASYPAVSFLPVTRGMPDVADDPAYGAAQLRTNFVWALALHARP